MKILKIPFRINGFDKSCDEKVEIIKPHGSISFVPKGDISAVYSVNYNLDFEGVPIEQLEIQYDNLTRYPKRCNYTTGWRFDAFGNNSTLVAKIEK